MHVDTEIFDMTERKVRGWPKAPPSVIVFGNDDGEKTVDFWDTVDAVDEYRLQKESWADGKDDAEQTREQHLRDLKIDEELAAKRHIESSYMHNVTVTQDQIEAAKKADMTIAEAQRHLGVSRNAVYRACVRFDITLKRGQQGRPKRGR